VITLGNVTSLLERSGSCLGSDIHRFVPVVVGGATKLQLSYQDVMIGPLSCEFMGDEVSINMCPFISRCFRNIGHRFQAPSGEMKSRVGAMISQWEPLFDKTLKVSASNPRKRKFHLSGCRRQREHPGKLT
jgi:hypothetical protein